MSPQNQERVFPIEYAHELLRIAQADLSSAAFLKTGVSNTDVRGENVAYLFQQAIEKALKAVLCAAELPIPLVHDLGVLIAKIPPDLEPDFGYELSGLDEYATIRRYEEGRYVLTVDELDEIERISRHVLDWAAHVVGVQ